MYEEEARLPTHLWLEAKIRELMGEGLSVYVAHKGEKMGGLVLLKISDMAGACKLLTQQRDIEGVLGWKNAREIDVVEEGEAESYIKRSIERDPDLWVIEIEDREMKNPFEG